MTPGRLRGTSIVHDFRLRYVSFMRPCRIVLKFRFDSQSAHTRNFFGSILTIDIKLYSISVMELAIATRLYFRNHRSMRRCFCALQRPYDSCRLCGSCVMFARILFVFKRSPRDILTSKDTANRLMSSLCYFKRLDFLILLSERLELFDLN